MQTEVKRCDRLHVALILHESDDSSWLSLLHKHLNIPPYIIHFYPGRRSAFVRRKRVQLLVLRAEDEASWGERRKLGESKHTSGEGTSLVQQLFYSSSLSRHCKVHVFRGNYMRLVHTGLRCGPVNVFFAVGTLNLAHTKLREVRKVYTAGVIPVAVEPQTKNVYLLLGREVNYDNTVVDNGNWCDFGGHSLEDENILTTAAREFTEESLGVVRLDNASPVCRARDYATRCEKILTDKQYLFYVHCQYPGLDCLKMQYYYVLQVPWQADLPNQFQHTRKKLLTTPKNVYRSNPHPALDQQQTVQPQYLEKQTVQWWSLDRLLQVVRGSGKYKHQKFRKSFQPGLQAVCEKLEAISVAQTDSCSR